MDLVSPESKEGPGPRLDQEMSLYFMAMQQLPFDPADEYVDSLVLRYYDDQGQLVEEEDDSQCYYGCRYAPRVMSRSRRVYSPEFPPSAGAFSPFSAGLASVKDWP